MLHLTSNVAADRRPSNLVTMNFAAGEIQFVEQSGGVLIDLTGPCRTDLLRVAFNRGEVQLAQRGVDLTLDITAKHFDVTGYPRREHACGTLTRVETQRLIAALVVFLASTPGTSEVA